MSQLTNEQIAMMPAELQDKYIQSSKKTCEQRCEDHLRVYTEHIMTVISQNQALKEKIQALEHKIEGYKAELDISKVNIGDLEDTLKVYSRQEEKLEQKCLKLQKKMNEREKHMSDHIDNLERSIRGEHEAELIEAQKKYEAEMKLASAMYEKSLAKQQQEAQQKVEKKEDEITELSANIRQLEETIRDQMRTIAGMDTAVSEEKERCEELLRAEKLKANMKVDKLQEELDFLKECYEAFLARNLDKEISGLKDTVTRQSVIVQQREEEVAEAKKETDHLHNFAGHVEMANVEMNLRLINKTKKLSTLETKYEGERARHRETRVKLSKAETLVEETRQECTIIQRKALSLEKETLLLQQKLKRQQNLFEHFQLDLQGCVEVMVDRAKFKRRFKDLARLYLDRERVQKLGCVVQDYEEKLAQMRSRVEYVTQSMQHEHRLMQGVVKRVEDKHVSSFLHLKYYTNMVVEDLGLLREKCKAMHSGQKRPERTRELSPGPRTVRRVDCVPAVRPKQAQCREDEPESVGKGTGRPDAAKDEVFENQVSLLRRVSTGRMTSPLMDYTDKDKQWDGVEGTSFTKLPPIKIKKHLSWKVPESSSNEENV